MKAGIIGLDFFLSIFILSFFFVPLIVVLAMASLTPFIPFVPLTSGCMSSEGEMERSESEGVSIATLVVLEPERECVFVLVFKGVPPNDFLVSLLVIALLAYVGCNDWKGK